MHEKVYQDYPYQWIFFSFLIFVWIQ